MPLILITNDDGVQAPGLRALARALGALGEVTIVAPDREQSACSHALTVAVSVNASEIEAGVFAVDGTPADCVNLACGSLLPRRPDIVCSGINRGGNLGDDVFYSGTVGGAREATFFGLPAIAISLASKSESDYSHAATFAATLVAEVLKRGLPRATLLNVNVPPGKPRGSTLAVQGRPRLRGEPLGGGFAGPTSETEPMTDFRAVRTGLISVTPLHTDTTHHAALRDLRPWLSTLGNSR